MNISAQTVVEKMEEEIMQLADQVESDEEDAVREHARVLKAYCDILLASGTSEEKTVKRKERTPSRPQTSQPARPAVTKKTAPIESTSASQEKDIPSTSGNLLEF